MSCVTFNVGASFNLHGRTHPALSNPFQFRQQCVLHKSSSSSLFLQTLNLSPIVRDTCHISGSRPFHSVYKCAAQNSQPSASVGVDTNNNSREHCTYSVFLFPFVSLLLFNLTSSTSANLFYGLHFCFWRLHPLKSFLIFTVVLKIIKEILLYGVNLHQF